MEHTLSADFATRITALARTGAVHVAAAPLTPARAPQASRNGNPEKKGTFATPGQKKALAKAYACAIFRADSHRAAARRRVSQQ
jgi:hypothetical protein